MIRITTTRNAIYNNSFDEQVNVIEDSNRSKPNCSINTLVSLLSQMINDYKKEVK